MSEFQYTEVKSSDYNYTVDYFELRAQRGRDGAELAADVFWYRDDINGRLYPIYLDDIVIIGGQDPIADETLRVVGKIDTTQITIGGSYINETLSELTFYDAIWGSEVTLTDLIQGYFSRDVVNGRLYPTNIGDDLLLGLSSGSSLRRLQIKSEAADGSSYLIHGIDSGDVERFYVTDQGKIYGSSIYFGATDFITSIGSALTFTLGGTLLGSWNAQRLTSTDWVLQNSNPYFTRASHLGDGIGFPNNEQVGVYINNNLRYNFTDTQFIIEQENWIVSGINMIRVNSGDQIELGSFTFDNAESKFYFNATNYIYKDVVGNITFYDDVLGYEITLSGLASMADVFWLRDSSNNFIYPQYSGDALRIPSLAGVITKSLFVNTDGDIFSGDFVNYWNRNLLNGIVTLNTTADTLVIGKDNYSVASAYKFEVWKNNTEMVLGVDDAGVTINSILYLDAVGLGLDVLNSAEIGNHLTVGDKLKLTESPGDHSASPTLQFGDGGTGIYESADDTLTLTFNGSPRWNFNYNSFFGAGAAGRSYISSNAVTSTVPAFTFQGDINTGIGRAGDDELSLIAGGVEGMRITTTDIKTDVINELSTDAGVTIESVLIKDGKISLDYIDPPSSNWSMTLANKQLRFLWVAPVTADGAMELEISGAFTGDVLHIHQHTGNPGAGTHLIHLEADDIDVMPLWVDAAGTISAEFTKAIKVDTINEYTTNVGVTIEGVLLKDNDITLQTNTGIIYFGDGDTYIFESSDDVLSFYIGTGTAFTVDITEFIINRQLIPLTNNADDIGKTSYYWKDIYAYKWFIENATTYISKDGSNNLSFTDAVTGTKTLAELLAGGEGVTIGNTGQIPYSNTGTPGDDFNYSANLIYSGTTLTVINPSSQDIAVFDTTSTDYGRIRIDGATGADTMISFMEDGNTQASMGWDAGTDTLKIIKGYGIMTSQELLAEFDPDGSVDLYYNNILTFETISNGIKITDATSYITVTGVYIDYARASANYLWCSTSSGYLLLGVNGLAHSAANASIALQADGTIDLQGKVGVNIGAASTLQLYVYNNEHTTKAGSFIGVYPNVTSNTTNSNVVLNLSQNLGYDVANGITDSGYRMCLDLNAYSNDAGFLGTLNDQYGIRIQYGHYTGSGNGTITTAMGLRLNYLSSGSTTITNIYSIYSSGAAARMYHQGNVGIGILPGATYALDVNGTIQAIDFKLSSDRTLKRNIVSIETGLEIALALNPVQYMWKNNRDYYEHIGFIAQEVEKIRPELVSWDRGIAALSYSQITAINNAAIHQLNSKVESNEEKIERLEKRVKELENGS